MTRVMSVACGSVVCSGVCFWQRTPRRNWRRKLTSEVSAVVLTAHARALTNIRRPTTSESMTSTESVYTYFVDVVVVVCVIARYGCHVVIRYGVSRMSDNCETCWSSGRSLEQDSLGLSREIANEEKVEIADLIYQQHSCRRNSVVGLVSLCVSVCRTRF